MPAKRHLLAEWRKTMGFTQEGLAEAIGVDRSTVVRWERGETEPQPWHRPRLATALAISTDTLADLLGSPRAQVVPPGATVGDAVRGFRRMDSELGGARLYGAVTDYLRDTVGPRMFGSAAGPEGRATFAAACTLTEMAGWMAHDQGQDPAAQRHFRMAYAMARAAGDSQLLAHVLGSLGYLALHDGDARAALRFARMGGDSLPEQDRAPGVAARLSALRARACAHLGDADQCAAMIGAAERLLERRAGVPAPGWTNDFDEASLAVDAARCEHRLGRLNAARSWAERVLVLRAPQRVRSRAFALPIRASAFLAEGRVDEARSSRRDLLDSTRTLGSAPVLAEIRALDRRFRGRSGERDGPSA